MSFFKDMMLFGIGAASHTKEKVEELVDELIKRGEVASTDKSKTIEELQQRAQKATADLKKLIDERIEELSSRFRKSGEPGRLESEIEELRARIETLESKTK